MADAHRLRYFTEDLPGTGGAIKRTCEDFRVTELPLYPASGEGTHVYFGLRKRGLATRAAIERVARLLGCRGGSFGAAGLKDARALTEQTVSIEHLTDAQLAKLQSLEDDAVKVTWVSRHTNKLKMGHLAGNRFDIRIRDVGPPQLAAAERILSVLKQRGVPNYFGEQRFGQRGDNWQLGAAAVRGRLDEFIAILLGRPRNDDPPPIQAAREHFDAGRLEQALDAWPSRYRNERNALAAWIGSGGAAKRAFGAVDKFLKRFSISAFQSRLFNLIVDRRIDEIDTVRRGDLAKKTDSGGVFLVEDEAAESLRAARFEISATAPLFGYRVRLAEGESGRIERETLDAASLTIDDWRRTGAHKVKGTRRAMRFAITNADLTTGEDEDGPYLRVCFDAPPGCYATTVVGEIMKTDPSAKYLSR